MTTRQRSYGHTVEPMDEYLAKVRERAYSITDADVQAEYVFYHDVNGGRTIFNRTQPQLLQ